VVDVVIYSLGQMPHLSVLTVSEETNVSDVQLLVHDETGFWHSESQSGQSMTNTCSGLDLL